MMQDAVPRRLIMLRYAATVVITLILTATSFAQWSSDPSLNLALADNNNGSDQVQPKLVWHGQSGGYVSWFDANPSSPKPVGYDVFYQRLNQAGYEQLPHDGLMVADLSNSSTEDYGLDADAHGNALIAFLDTREGSNQQITAVKMGPEGKQLWGRFGVQLTSGSASSNFAPKIAATTDGGIIVVWTSNSNVVAQKLNAQGQPQWGAGVVFSESGYNYLLADLHAADNGSVIISWVREKGFGSNATLVANKISTSGALLWGASNLPIFTNGSLQFGNFPYFVPDGSGGAVFAWYTNSPALQCFAQHILAKGTPAFAAGGVAVSGDTVNVRVAPSAAYRSDTGEVFVFWTEEDFNQVVNGVYGQKFNSSGAAQWGANGLVLVPLGADQQEFVTAVQVGTGALVFWVDAVGFGDSTIQAARLDDSGAFGCSQFAVSSTPSTKSRLAATTNASGNAALVWEDDRIGNNGIYIQNVNTNCSLGLK
jgi:hypothetical protein